MEDKSQWTVRYLPSELLDGIANKIAYHKARAEWWKDKQAEVMTKLKEAGVKVTESLVAQYSASNAYSNSQRGSLSVNLDQELQTQLDDCTRKLKEHEKATSLYEHWQSFLKRSQQSESLLLTFDDYRFFFVIG